MLKTSNIIKLILVDGYGVLLSRGYPDTEAVLTKRYGIPISKLHAVIYTKYFNQAAERKITQAEAWQKAIDELGLPMTRQQLAALHYRLMKTRPREVEFIRQLRRRFKVVMLSKNTRSQFVATKRSHPEVWASVDEAINTWELGLPKASPATIRLVCRRYQVRPPEIVYIDDQEQNLSSARQLGVRTILYQTWPQFKRELTRQLA